MKFGFRIPSLKKRIAARTSWKRVARHSLGLKAPRGWGWLTNPKKAAYNRIYNRTTVGLGKGCLAILRDRQGDNDGTRQFVGILQLHQSYSFPRVEEALAEALRRQTYNLDSVKHVLVRQDRPEIAFSPLYAGLMPGVTDLTVAASDLGRYDLLLAGGAQ